MKQTKLSSKKLPKKKRLNDSELLIELKSLWMTGNRGKTNLYELLGTKHKVSKSRCLKMYDVMASEASKEVRQEQSNINVSETDEAVRNGLKSDLELEFILCQIASGNVEVEDWVKGLSILRSVSPMEVISAARTIFLKRGSNAAIKSELTGKDGQPLSAEPMVIKVYTSGPPLLNEE